MRGNENPQDFMFSYLSPNQRVPKEHPLRPIREMVDSVLEELSPAFDDLYSQVGRPSIPPELLLRALLLQILYSVRSERLLMEQLDYNLLFRWFVGLSLDDPIWDATVFSKNRERLLEGEVATLFFEKVLELARGKRLLCDEHFTVDGTLIEAWAGQKSFRKKGSRPEQTNDSGNPDVNFRHEKRSNATHESRTDPEARLYRKSLAHEAKLYYLGHLLMDNQHGLAVEAQVSQAGGRAERETALEMVQRVAGRRRITLGGDKGYDVREFVKQLREQHVIPHLAQYSSPKRSSAIDGRTTRHRGYGVSQKRRKRIEEIFGWLKTVAMLRKTRHRGKKRVGWMFTFAAAAYNLVRMRNLLAQAT